MPLDHQALHQKVHPSSSSSAKRERVDDRAERELDVFRLIARGLSNAEIGENDPEADFRDRVQAVALACEPGLPDADTR